MNELVGNLKKELLLGLHGIHKLLGEETAAKSAAKLSTFMKNKGAIGVITGAGIAGLGYMESGLPTGQQDQHVAAGPAEHSPAETKKRTEGPDQQPATAVTNLTAQAIVEYYKKMGLGANKAAEAEQARNQMPSNSVTV